MGALTTEVMGRVQDYLSKKKTAKNTLIHNDHSPVLIRDVKQKIRLWLAELGADNPEEYDFFNWKGWRNSTQHRQPR